MLWINQALSLSHPHISCGTALGSTLPRLFKAPPASFSTSFAEECMPNYFSLLWFLLDLISSAIHSPG